MDIFIGFITELFCLILNILFKDRRHVIPERTK